MGYLEKTSKSIRVRIFLLSLVIAIPATILVVFFNIRSLKESEKNETDRLAVIAHSAAIYNTQIVEGARQLLISLSASPQIKASPDQCHIFLFDLQNKYQRYANFGIVDSGGNLLCSAVKKPVTVNLSDRYFFQQIIKTNAFTVGKYNVSPLTATAVLNFGYPLPPPYGAIYLTLDLDWLGQFVSDLNLGKDIVLLVLDKEGVVLARTPQVENLVGKSFPSDPLVTSLKNQNGALETSGIDGVKRLYAYEAIGSSEAGPYIVAGIPKSVILAKAYKNLASDSFLSLFIIALSLLAGWYISNMIILRVSTNLKGLEQLKRDFVSLVSHQLRTPLTAIKYFNQILLSGEPGKLNPRQKEFLGDTLTSTNRLISLVGTLLNISRLESGRIVPNKKEFEIANLIENSSKLLLPTLRKRHLKLHLHLVKKMKLFADPKLISEVIFNLLNNAVKYATPNTKIELSVTKRRKEALIQVKNRGPEISTSERALLFTKFFRGEKAKKADSEGSGLGLYLCKLIIQAHSGCIGFRSLAGSGSIFYFTIPDKLS